jgi:hypothetical protein
MTRACFTDKKKPPSTEEIHAALGGCYPLWKRLVRFVETKYGVSGELSRWGGKRTGWNVRYRKGGRALVALHPQKDAFAAQVVLGRAEAERALELDLGEGLARMLREKPQLHDGKWLFIPVRCAADVEDVEKLLVLKRRPAKHRNT